MTENLFTSSMNELEIYAELLVDAVPKSKRREVAGYSPFSGRTKTVFDKEIIDLVKRANDLEHKPELDLNNINPMELAYKGAIELHASAGGFKPLTTICCSIGKSILLSRESIDEDEETQNLRHFGCGWTVLSPLLENDKFKLIRGKRVKDPYFLGVKDKDYAERLFHIINTNPPEIQTYARPTFSKPKPFTEFKHPVAGDLVRKTNAKAKKYFTIENCPIVFDAINKHMSIPYKLNQDVLEVYENSLEDDLFSLNNIKTNTGNKRQDKLMEKKKEGMLREINGTLDIARGIGSRTFWEYMFFDSRGRLYSSAVYFTHQGSKLSKSLFYLHNKKRLGQKGYKWLMIHLANTWGKDKLPIKERIQFSKDRAKTWIKWAEDPISNKQWQKADDPHGFLASILELKKALSLKNKYSFRSGLMVAIDASCSGLQHLSMMSRDEKSGALCNLIPGAERSDYYKTIQEHVWEAIESNSDEEDVKNRLSIVEGFEDELECLYEDKDAKAMHAEYLETCKELKELRILANKKGVEDYQLNIEELEEKVSELYEQDAIQQYQDEVYEFWYGENDNLDVLSSWFWTSEKSLEISRKICKRPCMTYFYSCGPKTMAQQLFKDFLLDLDGIRRQFCRWLTDRIYEACQEVMPGPTAVMNAFIEILGGKANDKNEDFYLISPDTKFLMYHKYRKPRFKRVKVLYKGKRIRLNLMVASSTKIDKDKVENAISPNIVHMRDAEQVALIITRTDYDVVCIHDSFSCCPADAEKLFMDSREVFCSMYERNILDEIFAQHGVSNPIELGSLDIEGPKDNDYCLL